MHITLYGSSSVRFCGILWSCMSKVLGPLKDAGSQYTAIYSIYMGSTKFGNHVLY